MYSNPVGLKQPIEIDLMINQYRCGVKTSIHIIIVKIHLHFEILLAHTCHLFCPNITSLFNIQSERKSLLTVRLFYAV